MAGSRLYRWNLYRTGGRAARVAAEVRGLVASTSLGVGGAVVALVVIPTSFSGAFSVGLMICGALAGIVLWWKDRPHLPPPADRAAPWVRTTPPRTRAGHPRGTGHARQPRKTAANQSRKTAAKKASGQKSAAGKKPATRR